MARSAEQVVRDFCALNQNEPGNVAAIVDACTPDVVYQNVPVPELRGHEAMRNFLTPNMTKCSAFHMTPDIIATAADGKTVLCERLDVFFFGDKSVTVPVMGIFVVRDDKIAEWRDYCDFATFSRDMRAIGQLPGPGIRDQYK